MPTLKNIEVHVTTRDGEPLPEYRPRHLHNTNTIFCFIESQTNLPFNITLHAHPPLPDTTTTTTTTTFLATLRLDNRPTPEKQLLLYTDPADPRFVTTETFKHRYTRGPDGRIVASGWVFRDVGIEDLIGALGIASGDKDAGPASREEELALTFGGLGREEREENRAALIEVVVERVVVGETVAGAWKPGPDDKGAGTEGRGSLRDVAHRVGREEAGRVEVAGVDAVFYSRVEGEEEEAPYAVFQFFYRGREALVRLGLLGGGEGVVVPGRTGRGEEARERLVRGVGGGEKRARGVEGEEGGRAKKAGVEAAVGRGGDGDGNGVEEEGREDEEEL